MPSSFRLLLFLRYPQPGKTKTRLIPALGAAGAAQLQRQMAEYLLAKISHSAWEIQVHFSGASLQDMQAWLGGHRIYRPQAEGALGEKLWSGFQSAFAEGEARSLHRQHNRVIAIGADCPDLSVQHIHQAFDQIEHRDLVLGPAKDGGYYLIGLRQMDETTAQKALFTDISWGSAAVFQQTMEKARRLDLSTAQLETLADIDRPQDLPIWHRLQSVA